MIGEDEAVLWENHCTHIGFRLKLFEMQEFRWLDSHKLTAGILKFESSTPPFKRCVQGEKSVRA